MFQRYYQLLFFFYGIGFSVTVYSSQIVRGVRIPLRDGIHLVADYYLPDEPGQYPAVMEVTPYLRNNIYGGFVLEYDHWTRNGFIFIIVDTRGQGDSEGEFRDVWSDTNDNFDILEWVAQQPWSNGKVAMRGASYSGETQLYAARSGSPYLSCITPNSVSLTTPALESAAYRSGVFHFKWAIEWVGGLPNSGVNSSTQADWDALLSHTPLYTADEAVYGKPLDLYRTYLDHEIGDSFWEEVEIDEEEFRNISIPTLTFTGWFDDALPGSIANFQGFRRFSPLPEKHFLIIGPWDHARATDGGYDFVTGDPLLSMGDITLPENSLLPALNITTAFFNWCLKGIPTQPLNSTVMVYLTGSNIWLNLPDYPPSNSEVHRFFMHSSGDANSLNGKGKLSLDPPMDEPADEITHDPSNPFRNYIKTTEGYKEILYALPVDISELLTRNDSLVYVTEPLKESVTVLGNVRLNIHVSTDVLDADFHAVLEDVSPDGSSIKLGPRDGGLAKVRFRNGYSQATPVIPEEPFELTINMYDMGHTFFPGHKLRLSIMSAMYSRAFPNPGTGNSIANDVEKPRIARNRVFHNSLQLSSLFIPVYNF